MRDQQHAISGTTTGINREHQVFPEKEIFQNLLKIGQKMSRKLRILVLDESFGRRGKMRHAESRFSPGSLAVAYGTPPGTWDPRSDLRTDSDSDILLCDFRLI